MPSITDLWTWLTDLAAPVLDALPDLADFEASYFKVDLQTRRRILTGLTVLMFLGSGAGFVWIGNVGEGQAIRKAVEETKRALTRYGHAQQSYFRSSLEGDSAGQGFTSPEQLRDTRFDPELTHVWVDSATHRYGRFHVRLRHRNHTGVSCSLTYQEGDNISLQQALLRPRCQQPDSTVRPGRGEGPNGEEGETTCRPRKGQASDVPCGTPTGG